MSSSRKLFYLNLAWQGYMCDHWETSPTKYTKEKANKEKRKENIHSPPITTHRISSDFFSWGACSQSALHWNHIGQLKATLCGTPDALTVYYHPVLFYPPKKVHPHMTWQRTRLVPHFISTFPLSCAIVDINYGKSMLISSKYARYQSFMVRPLGIFCLSSSSSHWL